MSYAKNTKVPVDRSRAEIEKTLQRYGAEQFISGYDKDKAMIGFTASGRQVRFVLSLSLSGKPFSEQVIRQRWRALLLCIKAKLETVSTGIATFENEFLAHVVLPDGKTVGEHVTPLVELAYRDGKMPKLLPAYGETEQP